MSTTTTESPEHPSLLLVSQLLRLAHEQGLTQWKLDRLLTSGLLARLLKSDPTIVNLVAFGRVLRLIEPLEEIKRAMCVKRRPRIAETIREFNIITLDTKHEEIVLEHSDRNECIETVFTQLAHPTYGKVLKKQQGRGVRSADLRELVTFIGWYDLKHFGKKVPIIALGTRTRGQHPEVFYGILGDDDKVYLSHQSSYGPFPPNSLFLGAVIG